MRTSLRRLHSIHRACIVQTFPSQAVSTACLDRRSIFPHSRKPGLPFKGSPIFHGREIYCFIMGAAATCPVSRKACGKRRRLRGLRTEYDWYPIHTADAKTVALRRVGRCEFSTTSNLKTENVQNILRQIGIYARSPRRVLSRPQTSRDPICVANSSQSARPIRYKTNCSDCSRFPRILADCRRLNSHSRRDAIRPLLRVGRSGVNLTW